jgi:hypothetical protein
MEYAGEHNGGEAAWHVLTCRGWVDRCQLVGHTLTTQEINFGRTRCPLKPENIF